MELVCETEKSNVGARFEGTEGMVQTGYAGFFSNPESLKTAELGPNDKPLYRSDDHVGNFLDCVKSRGEPVAPVEVGHRSCQPVPLGQHRRPAGQANKVLKWDPAQERFTNDDEANAMLTRPMRGPWVL